ncbi:histidine--tRNA ligase [Acidaminobacterium chupaoyuni]
MSQKIQRPKGTADVTPSEVHIWHYTEALLRETARRFGFQEIRFPTFEHTELFIRGVGDTTDVVQKEMYTFEDKGGRSITLRPEGTASVVRSYIENSLYAQGAPFKCYYIAPNFRYEKPQAGRLREHHQFGVECFGAQGFEADAEIISLAYSFLKQLGIDSVVRINSIGCPNCRPTYQKALKEYFEQYREELCDTCKERLEKNPLRILDCKSEICHKLALDAPHSVDYLCDDCHDHFEGLKRALTDMGIPFEVDTGIVRGLDYYTKTVFEFIGTGLGAQSTVCGGGRYDGLVSQLGGPETPGIGFGCGLERLIAVAQASGFVFPAAPAPDLFVVSADEEGSRMAQTLTFALRGQGFAAERDLCGRSVKAQMKHADRLGARFTMVLGASECESGQAVLKNMSTREQITVELAPAALCEHLK